VANIALSLLVVALFVGRQERATFLSAFLVLNTISIAAAALYSAALAKFHGAIPSVFATAFAATTFFVVYLVWWLGAIRTLMRSVEPERGRAYLRPVGLWLALLFVLAALPFEPMFQGPHFDHRRSNLWEYLPALLEGRLDRPNVPPPRMVDSAAVELAQPALLEAQFSELAPRLSGQTNIYALGLAGWSDQSVFVKELDGGLASLAKDLPIEGHVVRLINNPDTVETAPIASRQNFAAAIHAIARVMDRDKDVLLLFMTSHGSPDGVALRLSGELYSELSPDDVSAIFAREGIKNRIVIVSACFAGVFLKPLADDTSIVLTAADEEHTSFGCADDRDWTYFGDAFFNQSLTPGENLEQAFDQAKTLIGQWETRDGLTPSNPQGYFGRDLSDKLAAIYLHPVLSAPSKSFTGLEEPTAR
jgi:hypothetical protein